MSISAQETSGEPGEFVYPWSDAPEWAQWAATDEDGEARWHRCKPEPSAIMWRHGGANTHCFDGDECPNWRNSLQQRPAEPGKGDYGQSQQDATCPWPLGVEFVGVVVQDAPECVTSRLDEPGVRIDLANVAAEQADAGRAALGKIVQVASEALGVCGCGPDEFDYPWQEAPEWAEWAATDESGMYWWYSCYPLMYERVWGRNTGYVASGRSGRHCPNWRNSLRQRPPEPAYDEADDYRTEAAQLAAEVERLKSELFEMTQSRDAIAAVRDELHRQLWAKESPTWTPPVSLPDGEYSWNCGITSLAAVGNVDWRDYAPGLAYRDWTNPPRDGRWRVESGKATYLGE